MKTDEEGKPCKDFRPIRYAAHMDRCIYQYYAGLLNERYNSYAAELGINDVALAYRTSFKGKSNCDFARMAFEAIRNADRCFVFAGDFKEFFETLDHRYLKSQLRSLFSDGKIPDDYYHVLRGATKYSVWDIRDLLERNGLKWTVCGVKKLNRLPRVLSREEFRQEVRTSTTAPWKENGGKGIPQGLPISGVLANVYMIEFDKMAKGISDRFDGLYLRYSDDFIFVLPNCLDFAEARADIERLVASIPALVTHPSKTRCYCVADDAIVHVGGAADKEAKNSGHIDFLGFSFDGKSVRLKQRTTGRYYRRMYARMKRLYGKGERPSKKRVDKLYVDFSDWGRCPKRNTRVRHRVDRMRQQGNFLSYVARAQRAFPDDPIALDVKNHKRKMRRRSKALRRKGALKASCDPNFDVRR
ncbi:reverse transcriptase/maturase family protein [Adlercreutzia sp. ZJ473]|uniref:reverse transcriptase/maturase family protein n=1 Tax=Adlercreutzia sp. ZJ473 TaxID=2722822 RepID=UPI001551F5E1|nr:reverse transcriptase/maturase family protein [Adlercreutzia sp. ZJ473]